MKQHIRVEQLANTTQLANTLEDLSEHEIVQVIRTTAFERFGKAKDCADYIIIYK